ncbi:MAG: HAD family hydrolase [Antarcticimicrobium sp.]|uniref:HAD family hydrolase n=1 Tax=Antarcticimicrobium sp. TaxID=2824147 RepID=UPI002607B8F4|nr:HAD family hydrolase [Antarcticimicrobium sp.]MDF1717690.1 HAD family hydrolase [Antarcticimicrobium sp.]
MRPAALIFDVDGTLAETEEAHRRAFNETFSEAGLDWHWSRETYADLLRTTGGKERMRVWRAAMGDGPTDDEIPALHRSKTARYGDILASGGLALRPGVAELVATACARGQRLAVATTTNTPNVEALCQACWTQPADRVFDVIAAGDEVAAKKPAPDVYLLALERLGLRPADAVALEDSRNGVLSARAAGLPVIVTPSAYTAGDDFTGAQAVIPDLTPDNLPTALR